MLALSDLTLTTPTQILLQGFSAEIGKGERIGIFGPNGAGKSTFLKALLGLYPLATGQVQFAGRSIQALCSKIAYLPQDFEMLNADYSVLGFLKLLVKPTRLGLPILKKQMLEQCNMVLAQVNASHLGKVRLSQLSGGERKRVILAGLLLAEPEMLLLDEPLANLDLHYQQEIIALIDTLQKKHQFTLLMSAHDFNPVQGLLDRVLFIGAGKAVLDRPEAVLRSDVLSELYQTPLEVLDWQGQKWVMSRQGGLFMDAAHLHGETHV